MYPDWKELTPEEVERLITGIAQKVVEYEFETVANIFLGTVGPLAWIGTHTVGLWGAPFLDFMGFNSYEYLKLFSDEENLDKLIKKIDELKEIRNEKRKEEKERREKEVKGGEKKSGGMLRRLFTRRK